MAGIWERPPPGRAESWRLRHLCACESKRRTTALQGQRFCANRHRAPDPAMKILVFSDIHGDLAALNRLLAIEADYYFAAGDLVSWARGLEKVGPVLQRRGDRMCVLPGNHESEADIGRAVRDSMACGPFTGSRWNWTASTSPGSATRIRRRSTRPASTARRSWPSAWRRSPSLKPLVLICHAPPLQTALDEAGPRPPCRQPVGARVHREAAAGMLLLRPHPRGRRPPTQIGETRAVNVGKQGYLLEFGNL